MNRLRWAFAAIVAVCVLVLVLLRFWLLADAPDVWATAISGTTTVALLLVTGMYVAITGRIAESTEQSVRDAETAREEERARRKRVARARRVRLMRGLLAEIQENLGARPWMMELQGPVMAQPRQLRPWATARR